MSQLVVVVPFFMLLVSGEYFREQYHHIECQYQTDSIIVAIGYVSILVFVKKDLQLRIS